MRIINQTKKLLLPATWLAAPLGMVDPSNLFFLETGALHAVVMYVPLLIHSFTLDSLALA